MPVHLLSKTFAIPSRYLEDGVLGRQEQVPPLAQRVVHARTGEGSNRLKAAKGTKVTGNGTSGNHERGQNSSGPVHSSGERVKMVVTKTGKQTKIGKDA